MKGNEAADLGLVDYAVTQNANGDAAYIRGLEFAKQMLSQGPIAVRMAKKAINEGMQV